MSVNAFFFINKYIQLLIKTLIKQTIEKNNQNNLDKKLCVLKKSKYKTNVLFKNVLNY